MIVADLESRLERSAHDHFEIAAHDPLKSSTTML
jgi:hypothetical protein